MKKNLINLKISICLFIYIFLIYLLTGLKSKTHWDYFIRLAYAFLHQRLYLTEGPSWLNELVPVAQDKFYVVFPPMPAILLMPFVAVFGAEFSQTLFSQIIGSLNAVLAYLLFLKLKFTRKGAVIISLILVLGTNHWYLASVGSAWYIALIIGVFFNLLALIEFFGKKRYFLIGLLIGAAYWSRLPAVLSVIFPVLFILAEEKKKLKSLALLFSGILIFVLLNSYYNYSRFGTIFDVGYTKIPGVLDEADFQYGLFSLKNIPKQLKVIFLAIPRIIKQPPYIYPSYYGMALWLTTPAFFLILRSFKKIKSNRKKRLTFFTLITVLIMSIPALTHATVGFSQFGYRYAIDFTPFLIILTGLGLKNSSKKITVPLIALSFLINLWGVIWINKFNWFRW